VAMGALPEGGFARITCPVDLHVPPIQNRNWREVILRCLFRRACQKVCVWVTT
jgi:hypothetical protein